MWVMVCLVGGWCVKGIIIFQGVLTKLNFSKHFSLVGEGQT